LTVRVLVEDREKAMTAGCDDFDTKPVELPRPREKINRLLAPQCSWARGRAHQGSP
jgi:CheY-like chemotaxis protein